MSKEKKYCTECGAENELENEFCTECGQLCKKKENAEKDTQSDEQEIEVETSEEAAIETKETAAEPNKYVESVKKYIKDNKRNVGIAAGVLVLAIVLFFVFKKPILAKGTWTTSDEEFYDKRERYTVDISKNGDVEVFLDYADYLNGTTKLNFSVVEDEWEKADVPTRTVYVFDEIKKAEIVVPNLTYQYERADLVSAFSDLGVEYEVDERSDEVAIIFDFSGHPELITDNDLGIVLEIVDKEDKDNDYHEDYLIFDGFNGKKELFNR